MFIVFHGGEWEPLGCVFGRISIQREIFEGFIFHGWAIFIILMGLVFVNEHPHIQYSFELILRQSIILHWYLQNRELKIEPPEMSHYAVPRVYHPKFQTISQL